MNMFKPVKARSVEEYFDMLPEERKASMTFLHKFIQKTAPALTCRFAYNMLGYGSFKYVNYKKEIIDWPIVALASQKQYISIYVCAIEDGAYLAEKYKDALGHVSVGKSCIRFKKLEDLDMKTLAMVIKRAAKNPGLVGANERKKTVSPRPKKRA